MVHNINPLMIYFFLSKILGHHVTQILDTLLWAFSDISIAYKGLVHESFPFGVIKMVKRTNSRQ